MFKLATQKGQDFMYTEAKAWNLTIRSYSDILEKTGVVWKRKVRNHIQKSLPVVSVPGESNSHTLSSHVHVGLLKVCSGFRASVLS
jgi:hypothetical protein